MRKILITITCAAVLELSGCIDMQTHGPNGETCEGHGYAVPFYAHTQPTCRDANGNVVSSSSGNAY